MNIVNLFSKAVAWSGQSSLSNLTVLPFLFVASFFYSHHAVSQDWRSPIDHEIKLSGTFCELRSNHFHHGIDIKSSKGVSGDPVYAIGDGYIHRLRVQAAGYGNSIYIKHPEGYVSVYGHLLNVNPVLDSVVQAHQYMAEQFEIDIDCDSLKIPVIKGERIGRMGSTGYSFGPHLHFEIRDAATEVTINPLLFNFKIKDKIAPRLTQVRLDFLTKDGRVYGEKKSAVYRLGKRSYIKGDTIYAGAWRCGIAVRTQDMMDATHNKNGIYRMDVRVDSQLVYRFVGDSMHFSKSRAVNIVKDVVSYQQKRERWYLAYSQPGCPLDSDILFAVGLGMIETYASKARRVEIILQDINGNKNVLEFFLLRDEVMKEQDFPSYNYKLLYNEPNIIKLNAAELHCPEDAFYRNQYIKLGQPEDKSENKLSNVIQLEGETIPFHRPCTLRLSLAQADSLTKSKAVLLSCRGSDYSLLGGNVVDDWLECHISAFGEYVVYRDVRPPTIQVVRFSSNQKNGRSIQFKLFDEYVSRGRQAREVQCDARIDGKWVLMIHDAKSNTFTHRLNDLAVGAHDFVMRFWDHAGNEKTWTKSFTIQ